MVHNLGAGHHWSTNTGTVLGGKDTNAHTQPLKYEPQTKDFLLVKKKKSGMVS
jgi:hypothetical protein